MTQNSSGLQFPHQLSTKATVKSNEPDVDILHHKELSVFVLHIFLTSLSLTNGSNNCLPHIGNRASDVVKFLDKSLERLQLEYVDLYMVHMPFGFLPDQSGEITCSSTRWQFRLGYEYKSHYCVEVWLVAFNQYLEAELLLALEEQVAKGKVRAIGVSNFNLTQLERLMSEAVILPAVNQVELHAYLQQPELRTYCHQQGITVTAYSPLGSPGSKTHFQKKYNYSPETFPDLLGHSVVLKIAEAHRKTPAQILLRHLVQQKIAVIPKSTNPTRITENIQVFDFELSKNELDQLNRLDQDEKGRIIDFMFFKGSSGSNCWTTRIWWGYNLKVLCNIMWALPMESPDCLERCHVDFWRLTAYAARMSINFSSCNTFGQLRLDAPATFPVS
ncbi:unnamed protein product [Timema podura]|uniref:NADP-dependent oxidoreductase domain-containing protein n=1 Tax=Timema podura TaxID=61482 RepID=A0ABN7NKJ6_TIMPD|nr:unnamed protein product [Timema podura]